jgi:hypothetical protein
LTGTTDEVLERLAAYARAGVGRVLLQHFLHRDLDTIELIGNTIGPEVERL